MYQGALRLFLAMLVVYVHLTSGLAASGYIAVFAFYLISGYLITRVVNTRYNNGVDGLWRFGLNRFLRLFPGYWIVLLFSMAVVAAFPEASVNLFNSLFWPDSSDDWLAQIFVLGQREFNSFTVLGIPTGVTPELAPQFIPTATTLNVELIFYALIAVLLGRYKQVTLAWFALSFAHGTYVVIQDDFKLGYETFIGASLAFSSGAMLFHYRDLIAKLADKARVTPTATMALFSVALLGATGLWQDAAYLTMRALGWTQEAAEAVLPGNTVRAAYLALPFAAFAFWLCIEVKPKKTESWLYGPRMKWLNDLAGDLSYPIFLIHWPVAALIAGLTTAYAPNVSLLAPMAYGWLLIVLAATFAVCLVIVYGVERPIQRLRARVRKPSENAPPAAAVQPQPVAK